MIFLNQVVVLVSCMGAYKYGSGVFWHKMKTNDRMQCLAKSSLRNICGFSRQVPL